MEESVAVFGFTEAIELLSQGTYVTRKEWLEYSYFLHPVRKHESSNGYVADYMNVTDSTDDTCVVSVKLYRKFRDTFDPIPWIPDAVDKEHTDYCVCPEVLISEFKAFRAECFDYGKAVKHMLEGKKVRRKGWLDHTQSVKARKYVINQTYEDGTPIYSHTDLFVYGFTLEQMLTHNVISCSYQDVEGNLFVIKSWCPTVKDIVATDWVIVTEGLDASTPPYRERVTLCSATAVDYMAQGFSARRCLSDDDSTFIRVHVVEEGLRACLYKVEGADVKARLIRREEAEYRDDWIIVKKEDCGCLLSVDSLNEIAERLAESLKCEGGDRTTLTVSNVAP